jgi:hypothetical protein
MPTFICSCCHRTLPANPRIKNQRFCGQPLCQQARKTQWQKAKLASDPAYLQNQREACQTWRENHRDYWRQRRLKRSLSAATRDGPENMVSPNVNMDALAGHINQQGFLDISMEYMIIPLPAGQCPVDGSGVNMDALRVKFAAITAA